MIMNKVAIVPLARDSTVLCKSCPCMKRKWESSACGFFKQKLTRAVRPGRFAFVGPQSKMLPLSTHTVVI